MSNINNEDVLSETKFMSIQEYNELVKDPLFSSVHNPIEEQENSKDAKTSKEKLAFRYGLDEGIQDELDFPNLRNK